MLKQAVLLGNKDTKRTDYFKQAAREAKLPVLFVDWRQFSQWQEHLQQAEWMMKIDPPLWNSCSVEKLHELVQEYQKQLLELSQAAREYPLEFLNDPLVIMQLLDKRLCKKKLMQAGLTVTEMLGSSLQGIRTAEQLLCMMRQNHIYQVFIKPVYGSGAAGIAAFRWQPSAGQMVLYTSAVQHPQFGIVNTKRLRRFTKREEVLSYLQSVLKLDCVVERWYAKAEYQGGSYDLRAVVLDGKTEFLLGRFSKGPITNLHLNNHPFEIVALGIPVPILDETRLLCKKAMDCFPGLRSAGIDILLEKGSLRPRIIEMNAQGDLIYADIFGENRIYRRQAEMMREIKIVSNRSGI